MADTKKAILEAALDLFSTDGYDTVSVEKIASAVGIKAPSLYKHYKSKQDIFDSLITETTKLYNEHSIFSRIRWDDVPEDQPAPPVGVITEQVMEHLRFAVHDPHLSKVRRMLMINQYRTPVLNRMQEARSYTDIMRYHEGMFRHLIRQGVLRDGEPELMALAYTSPISVQLYRIDRDPACEEEALALVRKHITAFYNEYSVK